MFGFGRREDVTSSSQMDGNKRSSVASILKDRQIASLMAENPTISQSKPGVFQLGLQLPDKKIIVLRVALGDTFPTTPPVLQIMTHATHPWLSTDGYCRVVGHPDLNNWNPHCSLGAVVKAVVTEFCTRPPVPVAPGSQAGKERSAQKQQTQDTGKNRSNSWVGSTNEGTENVDTSTLYNALQDITIEQHREMIYREVDRGLKQVKDPATVQLLIEAGKAGYDDKDNSESSHLYKSFLENNVSCIETWNSVIEEQLEQNAEKAKANLEKQSVIQELTSRVTTLQRELMQQDKLYQQHLLRQNKIAERFRPRTVYELVSKSATQLEEESEEFAYDFHNDTDVSVNEFLKVFLDKRVLSHRRRSMAEAFEKRMGYSLKHLVYVKLCLYTFLIVVLCLYYTLWERDDDLNQHFSPKHKMKYAIVAGTLYTLVEILPQH